MQSSKYQGSESRKLRFFPNIKFLLNFKKQIIVSCTAIFILATALALYQPVNPSSLSESQSWQRFIYPKETNPDLKLAGVGAELKGMTNIGKNIWVVGEQGTILHSDDGGTCWRPQGRWINPSDDSDTEQAGTENSNSDKSACSQNQTGIERLFSIFPSFAANISNSLSAFPTANAAGEKDKNKSSDETDDRPAQSSMEQVIVTGSESKSSSTGSPVHPYKSAVGDRYGSGQSYNQPPMLNSVSFADNQFGVSVGEQGVIVTTNNGGKQWTAARHFSEFDLYSVAYGYDNSSKQQSTIVAVGQSGIILISRDFGNRWQTIQTNDREDLLNVSINKNGSIVAVGDSSSVFRSDNNGKTWSQSNPSGSRGFDSAFITENSEIYVAGADGVIKQSSTSSSQWRDIAGTTTSQIHSIVSQFGILAAVNENNELLTSKNQANSWQVFNNQIEQSIIAVRLVSVERAIVLTEEGIIYAFDMIKNQWHQLTTNDVGQSESNDRYTVSVAPWWYVVTFICAGLILIVIWPREDDSTTEEGIAGMAASDRPLKRGDPDALNLGKIASDVTAFLSNPKTSAPLTLAITGPWGCGKSSLMNLIRADLKDRGFLPVWFNAWHHQKGEQLLASLFAHITQQAIPPWFSFDGVIFRAKLVAIRGRRHWFIFALMMFLLFMTWAINDGNTNLVNKLQGMNWGEFWAGLFGGGSTANQNNQVSIGSGIIPMMASLFGVAAPLIALLRSVKGFGISPEKLVSVDHRSKNKTGYDPGARVRFADEFADVTTALGNNKMVIFIDDLDRCSQENLIDILENINFISSSGDCYLLLGMAPKYIEACVANAYETLAHNIAEKERFEERMVSENDEIKSISNKEKHKFSFARQYLEKMINIEVPIPSMSENSIERLLHQSEDSQPETESEEGSSVLQRFHARIKPLLSGLNRAMPLIFIIVAIKAGWDYGKSVPDKKLPTPSVVNLGTIDADTLASIISPQSEIEIDSNNLPKRDFQLSIEADQKLVTQGLKVASLGSGNDKVNLILTMSDSVEEKAGQKKSGQTKAINNTSQSETSRSPRSRSSMTEPNDSVSNSGEESLEDLDRESFNRIPFRAESLDISARLSGAVLLLFILLFSSFSLYIFRQQKQKFSKDSRDFIDALNRWTPWIQIKQETPRAIKRFLNHLRYQSIRNRKAISESLLVAYASIAFFEKSWIINDKKFEMICEGRLADLLALQYQNNLDQANQYKMGRHKTDQEIKDATSRWEKLAKRMSESLKGIDKQALRDNRQQALNVLQSDTLEEK
ncbi:MAG: hypothetical protein KUG78_20810 [Kangiellaceae bacterium]|nr:hypothetical protein [Kangiellaceae bacterium]